MMKSKETYCIHSSRADQGVNTPIYPSTSNKYMGYDKNVYPRYYNTPNQEVIVEKLCNLEQAEAGMIFSSGMAAISTTLLALLKPGDHILFSNEIYGGTFKLITDEFQKFGIEYDFVAGGEASDFKAQLKENTKAIYFETPSNPLLSIIDLEEFASFASENGLITFVDNTFASPINQNPISFGIDVVFHSGTKYLSGHSDLCFGATLTSKNLADKIWDSSVNFGGSLNALDCYLIERSLKTLAVRVKNHNSNAQIVAEYLDSSDLVSRVNYPGLTHHPNHSIAKKQSLSGFGGMLSFELKNGEKTEAFLNNLEMIPVSLSLGGVETTICQPSKTSHSKMSENDRLKLGITDQLLRLSVGIESSEDIIGDLQQAMEKIS